jgi:hypothetical protein
VKDVPAFKPSTFEGLWAWIYIALVRTLLYWGSRLIKELAFL